MRILRVWYEVKPTQFEKQGQPKERYDDYKLTHIQQDVLRIELLDVIPESVMTYKTFQQEGKTNE